MIWTCLLRERDLVVITKRLVKPAVEGLHEFHGQWQCCGDGSETLTSERLSGLAGISINKRVTMLLRMNYN